MFQGKNASSLKKKVVVKVKIINVNVNVVDINVPTISIITKDQVFHEREPSKNKSTIDWKKEEKLNKTIVETIQQFQKQ
jgi:outer membrane protease